MEILGLLAGVFLPWCLGVVWLRARWIKASSVVWPTLLGYGYLTGALATTLVMRLLNAVGIGLNFTSIAVSLLFLIALGIWAGRGTALPWKDIGRDWRALKGWQKAAFGVLLAILAVRLLRF